MRGRCPRCRRAITVGDYAETVICRYCGVWTHPEYLLPPEEVERA